MASSVRVRFCIGRYWPEAFRPSICLLRSKKKGDRFEGIEMFWNGATSGPMRALWTPPRL
ncbi:hypothetical protein D3C72_2165790 [compost metagenome]